MLIIYTGNGKGKTSAALGQVLRALGHDMRVAFGQFMKRGGQAGEQKMLTSLLGAQFFAGGAGFFTKEAQREMHRNAAVEVLTWVAGQQKNRLDMLILDESVYALGAGLITQDELLCILDTADEQGCHVILSGRGVPSWLYERADLVTEMQERKHPFTQGTAACKGVDF